MDEWSAKFALEFLLLDRMNRRNGNEDTWVTIKSLHTQLVIDS